MLARSCDVNDLLYKAKFDGVVGIRKRAIHYFDLFPHSTHEYKLMGYFYI